MNHPKFNDIIRNYVNREADKNQELQSLESLLDKATKIYPDLCIKIRNNDKNIATDIFFAFSKDISKCIKMRKKYHN